MNAETDIDDRPRGDILVPASGTTVKEKTMGWRVRAADVIGSAVSVGMAFGFGCLFGWASGEGVLRSGSWLAGADVLFQFGVLYERWGRKA